MPRIVCISDTHMHENNIKIPKCDILIHAGDYDIRTLDHLQQLIDWFDNQPAKYKVCIAGNHDFYLESSLYRDLLFKFNDANVEYLENVETTIEGIKIYGSPHTPIFGNWAFMRTGDELKEIWNCIPKDADIVITHGPAFGILDQSRTANGDLGMSVGCSHLRDKLKEIKPKYHICGHIHEGYGVYQDENTTYINASIMDKYYNPVNKPIIIDY